MSIMYVFYKKPVRSTKLVKLLDTFDSHTYVPHKIVEGLWQNFIRDVTRKIGLAIWSLSQYKNSLVDIDRP